MNPLLAAFLAEASRLHETLRYQRLDRLDRYYQGTQYEERRLDVAGYFKASPGVYGSMVRTPPWTERDPGSVWNVGQEIVQELTDWTLAGDSWCHLEIADDDEAEDWLNTVAQQATMSDVLAQARNYGGAQGVACVSFAIRDGEVSFEAHNPKHCWPLAWRDARRHRPAAIVSVYRGENPMAKSTRDLPLVARYWDEQTEAIYQQVWDETRREWSWREVETVTHGLGFCPVYWHPQRTRDCSHEGTPDGGDILDEIDDVVELSSAASCTTKRNSDDTLVVKEDPALNPGKVHKGGHNTIFSRGGAEYLSQKGDSAKVCEELAEKRAQRLYRRCGVVMVDLETLGKATTGEALRRLFQRTLKTTGMLRRDYARGLIVPLCQGLLDAARRLGNRNQAIVVPPRVVEDKVLGVMKETPRSPGTSSFVTCVWPDAFQPTMQDLQAMLTTASTATGGKQVMSRRTALAWLKMSPLPIQSVEEELEQIKHDEEEAAERTAASIGMAPEPEGKAGAVGGKAEGDDEEEEPASEKTPATDKEKAA